MKAQAETDGDVFAPKPEPSPAASLFEDVLIRFEPSVGPGGLTC
jgi:hypothetical protein